MKIWRIFSVALLFAVFGCNQAKFGGGGKTGVTNPTSVPSKTDSPPPNDGPTIKKPGAGGPLTLDDIADQKVNSGNSSESYSETLLVQLKLGGGNGEVSVTVTTSSNSPKAGLVNSEPPAFNWTPGYRSGGEYKNEVGEHTVTISASDASGQKVEKSFKVTVKPLAWNNITRDMTADTDMVADLNVTESLHANRTYAHEGTIGGASLNTQHCVSFTDASGGIDLLEAPRIDRAQPEQEGDVLKHPFTLTYRLPISQQPADKIALVTWINFVPSPLDNISGSQAKPILVYFSFARCKTIRDQAECKRATATEGIQNFYYCSDYYQGIGSKTEELKAKYCALANLEGVKGTGCP